MHSKTISMNRTFPFILLPLLFLSPMQSRGQHMVMQQQTAGITIVDENGRAGSQRDPRESGVKFLM